MNKGNDFKHMFGIGDYVFAKVKGYPHWPARVISVENKTSYNIRYHVHFYGTNQKGVVKIENVCHYLENKSKYGKLKKNKHFIEALVEIERDLYHQNQPKESKDEDTKNKEAIDQKRAKNLLSTENVSVTTTAEKVSQSKSIEDSLKRKVVEPTTEIDDPKTKKSRNFPDLSVDANTLDESSSICESLLTPSNDNTPSDEGRTSFAFDQNSKEDSADGKGGFILASINESEKVKIPLNLNSPDFTSDKSKSEWNKMVMLYAKLIKNRIENGVKLDAYEKMDTWTTLKAIDFTESNNLKRKEEKIKLMRTEAQLIDLDINIRQSLNTISPDTDACLLLLDHLNNLAITPLMLKKHPEIVSNISKIRNYVGNIKSWNMTEDAQKLFEEKADRIRIKSQTVYAKFKALFNIEKCDSFLRFFTNEVDIFQKKTLSLTPEEILSLTEELE